MTQNSYWLSGDRKFSDPFLMPSSSDFPDGTDRTSIFDFCAYLWSINETFREASKRAVGYFITDIKFEGAGGDSRERKALKSLLVDAIDVKSAQLQMGMNSSCYGNGLVWIWFPFNRVLVDTREKGRRREGNLRKSCDEYPDAVKYNYQDLTYTVPDPMNPSQTETFEFFDRWSMDLEKIRIKHLDPRHVVIRYSEWSTNSEYVYCMPQDFRAEIKDNHLWQINDTPMGILKAVAKDDDFLFAPGEVFHMAPPKVVGATPGVWGIPDALMNFHNIYQLQIYRKMDQVIGLDYTTPFRIFSPNASSQQVGDSTWYTAMPKIENDLKNMVAARRKDPFSVFYLPFPVQLQEAGGDKNMAMPELRKFQETTLLDGMGFPAGIYRGDFTNIQQVPTQLRLFEVANNHQAWGQEAFLRWLVRKITDHASVESIAVSQEAPALAGSIDKQMQLLQLATGKQVSMGRALKEIGIDDPIEEAREIAREEAATMQVQQEEAEKAQRAAATGGMRELAEQSGAIGGAPADVAGQMTPLDTMKRVEEEASTIVSMPTGQAQQRWDQLRAGDQNFYASVKLKAEEYRRGAESSGRQQLKQPQ